MMAPEGAMCLRWRQIIQFAFFFFFSTYLLIISYGTGNVLNATTIETNRTRLSLKRSLSSREDGHIHR